jgi:hypothetical protein
MSGEERGWKFQDAQAPAHNRRSAFRLPVALDIAVQQAGEPPLETVTEDLSVAGLRFRSMRAIELETPLEVTLHVELTRLVVAAVVVRNAPDRFGNAVAVRFTEVEGRPAQSEISRFVFARERRRLPRVSVMYPVHCVDGGSATDGATEECSPGFAWLLLNRPTEAGSRLAVDVTIDKTRLALRGRAVGSVAVADLWRTGVEFETIAPRWNDVVIDRHEGRR